MNHLRIASGVLIAMAVAIACTELSAPLAPAAAHAVSATSSVEPRSCSPKLSKRTPEEVLDDHRAALAVGDLDAAACNFAPDAVVISDGGIDDTPDQIRSSLAFFLAIFEGTMPQVIQQIVVETPVPHTYMVRLLFTIDTPCITVPDGIDTYIIRRGQILSQTSHAFPVFQCF